MWGFGKRLVWGLVLLCSAFMLGLPGQAKEQDGKTQSTALDLVFFEARLLPQTCETPLQCLPNSRVILRNIARLEGAETKEVVSFLNRIAVLRGLPNSGQQDCTAPFEEIQAREIAAPLELLKKHPGLYFESAALDRGEATANFGDFIRLELQAAGVRFLSEKELDAVPGRPRLTVRYSQRRESEGCIIPFSVSMTLLEETILVRDPKLKVISKIWTGTARQNLANRNYTTESALREVVARFVQDWKKANTN